MRSFRDWLRSLNGQLIRWRWNSDGNEIPQREPGEGIGCGHYDVILRIASPTSLGTEQGLSVRHSVASFGIEDIVAPATAERIALIECGAEMRR